MSTLTASFQQFQPLCFGDGPLFQRVAAGVQHQEPVVTSAPGVHQCRFADTGGTSIFTT
ncbi:hypothetical protein [Streptomyces sp. DB-54]